MTEADATETHQTRATPPSLDEVLDLLRRRQAELRKRGVLHAAVFGSVVRGEAGPDSDIDILLDLDPTMPMGIYAYTGIELDLSDWLGFPVQIADREHLKPGYRENILAEAQGAF